MVSLIIIQNLIFLSILSLTMQTSIKSKFLPLSADLINIKNTELNAKNQQENIFDLISKHKNKLLKKLIFSELAKNDSTISKQNKQKKQKNSIVEKNLYQSILLENITEQKFEPFFNSTEFIWENMPTQGEAPSPRRGHSMILADTYLVIFGGSDLDSKFYNDVYFFDLLKKTWMKVNTLGNVPSPRADHSAVLYGTTMWIFGGASSEGYLNDLYSFNIENRQWKKHNFMGKSPRTRSGHSAVIDDQAKIWIFGGYSELGHANDIFVINILNERYENPLLSGKAPAAREKAILFLYNQTLYIYGGHQNEIIYNDLLKLNLINLIWEKVNVAGFIPVAYKGFSAERVGKQLYVTGGCDFENKFCNEEIFIFETTNSTWSKLSNLQNKTAQNALLANKTDNVTLHSNRSFATMQFFRGSLVAFGGCEMHKKCFNDLNILNIEQPCPNDCSGNGSCKSKLGCQCLNDFILQDCSMKIKCKEDCNKNGFCKSNAKCSCFGGWTGDNCATIVNCPRNCTSYDNGVCQLDGHCKCNSGYLGNDCGNSTNSISPLMNLINSNDRQINEANKGLHGTNNDNADQNLKENCPNNCSGNGDCNAVLKKCDCKEPFFGDDCSKNDENKFESAKKDKVIDVKPMNIPVIQRKVIVTPEKVWRKFYINNTLYQENDKCEGGCGEKGICLNSTCLCNQGFTGEKCSMTYKDILEQGYYLKKYLTYFLLIGGLGMLMIIFYIIYKR